ncbi:MAG: helix-turn-helix transcriptional regulator [Allorhizobium sp.]
MIAFSCLLLVRRRMIGLSISQFRKLTPREVEVLTWTSQGKTAWEVSVILSISKNTVHTHLRNSKDKLDTSNVVHTIVEAVRRNQIKI